MVRVSRAGWLLVLVPLIAAYLFGRSRHSAQMWLSVGVAVIVFWSLGVMHNYAYSRDDPQAAPNWAAMVSMVASLVGIGMLIWALVE
jgi:hypothetical protein